MVNITIYPHTNHPTGPPGGGRGDCKVIIFLADAHTPINWDVVTPILTHHYHL